MTRMLKDSDPEKWRYAFHIYVKHTLFKKYFEAWSIILGKVFRNIGYLDGFAGRGKYVTSNKFGSPILALRTLTENEQHFESCQCVLIEKDPNNFKSLCKLLKQKQKEYSPKISIDPQNSEFSDILVNYLDALEIRPFFVFLDPFGFKGIPLSDIKEILSRSKNEVFITLMTKNINRFITSKDHQKPLSDLLGGEKYLDGLNSQDDVANRYSKRLSENAKYVIHYQVGADKKKENMYYLIHASNHFKGFKIMKNIMFSQGREGQFAYRGIKDLRTNSLMKFVDPEREKTYMKKFLLGAFQGKTATYLKILKRAYIQTNYIEKHCRSALQELEKENLIIVKRKGRMKHRGGLKDNDLVKFVPPVNLDNFFTNHTNTVKKKV